MDESLFSPFRGVFFCRTARLDDPVEVRDFSAARRIHASLDRFQQYKCHIMQITGLKEKWEHLFQRLQGAQCSRFPSVSPDKQLTTL